MKLKDLILVLILILLFNKIASSQSGWFWQNPYPQGNTLNDISVIDEKTAVAVGTNGTFMKTTNGGLNWTIKIIETLPAFQSVQFINNNTGWISDDIGKLYSTSNGGNNWNVYYSEKITKFYFIDENTGWGASLIMFNEARILKTTNGGINWQLQQSTASSMSPFEVYFTDNNTGWVLNCFSTTSQVEKTTNGGLNWFNQTLFVGNQITSFNFIDNNIGWAAGNDGIIVKTTNGGNNWINQISGSDAFLYSIKFNTENTGWAIGGSNTTDDGIILRTTNGGNNWENQLTTSNIFFTKINYYDINSIYCIGYQRPSSKNPSGRIFKTMNSGNNWVEISKNTTYKSLLSVQFLQSDTGWTVGMGLNLKTTNGGINWQSNLLDPAYKLYSLSFINNFTGWVAGSDTTNEGIILRTENGGINWETQINIPNDNYFSIFFLNSNKGWAAGSNFDVGGIILQTSNGGLNWSRYLTGNNNEKKSIFFIDENTGWAVGGIDILKTTNSGNSWFSLNSPHQYLNSVFFVNNNTGWVINNFSQSNGPYKSTDGGISWILQPINAFFSSDIKFINSNTGWIVGASVYGKGVILKTTDGGDNWIQQNNPSGIALTGISVIDDSTAWVVGANGTILSATSGPTVSIRNITTTIIQDFTLEQNYPNPFNPNTKIIYALPLSDFVTLKVYDISGREVATLVNEQLNAGRYEATFNGANFASGVYFYKIQAGNYSSVKRMVLIK